MKRNDTEFGSQLPDDKVVNFEHYLGLLLSWNRTYNLTAITDPFEVYEKHFADSATPLEFIPRNAKLLDIGTGAGFPGVPIKILRDDIEVTLIDSKTKKTSFCEHVIRELKLKKIRVVDGRAEDRELVKKTGKFDVVVSRASLKLPGFVKVGSGYLKDGGRLIAMMGKDWQDQLDLALSELKKSSMRLAKIHEYTLPMTQSRRALIILERK